MKTKILLLACWLLPAALCAQSHYTFYYDQLQKRMTGFDVRDAAGNTTTTTFATDDDLSKVTPKSGDFIVVKINNINTYAYTIAITVENQSFNQTPPKLLASLFTDFDPSAIAAAPHLMVHGVVSPAPRYPQSTALANDIHNVIIARQAFFNRNLALSYRNFDATTPAVLNNIRTMTLAGLMGDYNNAVRLMSIVETNYLIDKAAATDADDKAVLDDLYKAYSAKDYPSAFETYLTQQLNVKPDDFQFTTPPVAASGEKIHITVAITPVAATDPQKTAAANAAISREYFLNTRNLWHWSFSTGFFMSTLGSRTYTAKPLTKNNNAATSPVDTITGYQNVEDNNTKVVVGATALIHYTYKVTPGLEVGGHFGLGVPINTSFNMNYLLGGSLFFFNDNRLGLNFGLAAGYAQQLSPNVATNIVYKKSGDIPISYVDKFRVDRIQFSITYNLSDLFKSAAPAAAKN